MGLSHMTALFILSFCCLQPLRRAKEKNGERDLSPSSFTPSMLIV